MKSIALVLLFLSFVAITTAQSQGCIVINGNSDCPAPTQWQSPNTASGSTSSGPAPFNELEAFQVCSGSCAAPSRRASVTCPGGNFNVTVELQACDVSTASKDQFVPGFDNDTCLTWGYAPARVVQTVEITIDCTTLQCQCIYIPQAIVLSISDINQYVFGVVFTNGNPAGITISNTVTCPSSSCSAPAPVFDGTITTASITTGTGIITTGTPPFTSSSKHSSAAVVGSSSSSSSSLALILGLALGLGIPFLCCCCLLLIAGIILLILFLKRGGVSSNTFWMPSRT